jgi:hypothetical protein
MSTSVARIQQSIEQNRILFEQHAAEVRADACLTASQRRKCLAECWFDAMRTHYRLLGEYLSIRDTMNVFTGYAPSRLMTAQLRAPRRPDELPESLSRYVLAAHHSEHLI